MLTAGKRSLVPQATSSASLEAFRFVPSKHSRFKAPVATSTSTKHPQYAQKLPGGASRVLAEHVELPEQSCLPPLVPQDSALQCNPRVMILGSAPSVESLAKQQYYAHKMNHFWPVVAGVFQLVNKASGGVPFPSLEYQDRVKCLWQAGVIVWDVCQLFVRLGSSDSNLKCRVVNPVEQLLVKYPSIKVIGLNGQAAHKIFVKHVVKAGKLPRDVRYVCLPSTSPLHAMKNAIEKKAKHWRESLQIAM